MGNKYQIPYINACIRAFAKRFKLSVQSAFEYLYKFKGIQFLVEFYEVEHLQSIDDAVDDLIVCCLNNGGTLTIEELSNRLEYKKLNNQYFFGTEKSLKYLKRV